MKFLFANYLSEGGPLFMYTILISLIVCVALIIKVFLKGDSSDRKAQKLISHISLFALVFGFLGFMIGMIGALDAISIAGNIAPDILAAGLKIGMLSPAFGMLTFIITRLGLIGLTLKNK